MFASAQTAKKTTVPGLLNVAVRPDYSLILPESVVPIERCQPIQLVSNRCRSRTGLIYEDGSAPVSVTHRLGYIAEIFHETLKFPA